MADTTRSFLIDLLAVDGAANAHGCGLEPRLLELLLDRHATYPGTVTLNRTVRHYGSAPALPTQSRAGLASPDAEISGIKAQSIVFESGIAG